MYFFYFDVLHSMTPKIKVECKSLLEMDALVQIYERPWGDLSWKGTRKRSDKSTTLEKLNKEEYSIPYLMQTRQFDKQAMLLREVRGAFWAFYDFFLVSLDQGTDRTQLKLSIPIVISVIAAAVELLPLETQRWLIEEQLPSFSIKFPYR